MLRRCRTRIAAVSKTQRVKFPVADKQAIEMAYQLASPKDFYGFIRGLKIPSAHGPRTFATVMADFQETCFKELAPNIQALRDGELPKRRRFWIERTKKSSKDGDIGAALLWLVAFPTRPLYIQVGAADRDQAGIVRRRIKDILFNNPWLENIIEIQRYKVRNKNGLAEVDILAADVSGSHGETPDMLILNELSHVTKWEFLQNLMDNATGVPRGIVVVATNAGFKGTTADVWRRNAIKSDDWFVHIWDKPSPWLSPSDIDDAKKRNTIGRFNRLYYGKWSSGKGDAFDERDIDAMLHLGDGPVQEPESGWMYVCGLDLGVSHDHAGLVMVGVHVREQRMKLAYMRGWEPSVVTNEINLQEIEDTVAALAMKFRAEVHYDPWQAKLMSQRLRKRMLRVIEMPFTGSRLSLMANTLKEVIENRKLEAWDDEEQRLRRDLGKLSLVEKPYGYRLEAVSDEFGHADVGIALAICLPRAVEMLAGRAGLWPDEDIADLDDTPLSKDEIEKLPRELRDIYDAMDEVNKESKLLVEEQEEDEDASFIWEL